VVRCDWKHFVYLERHDPIGNKTARLPFTSCYYRQSDRVLFSFVGFALSFCFSYSVAVELGRRQARKNGISVWHLRCEHCHVKYRIVRPYGAPIPWEYPEDHDQEIDNEDSE
jgi:hypothetical protein